MVWPTTWKADGTLSGNHTPRWPRPRSWRRSFSNFLPALWTSIDQCTLSRIRFFQPPGFLVASRYSPLHICIFPLVCFRYQSNLHGILFSLMIYFYDPFTRVQSRSSYASICSQLLFVLWVPLFFFLWPLWNWCGPICIHTIRVQLHVAFELLLLPLRLLISAESIF